MHVVEQALVRGHSVIAFVRSPDKLPFDDENVEVVFGDANKGCKVETAVAAGEAFISTLRQSRNTPSDLLTVAGRHIIEAMETKEILRLFTLLGAGIRSDNESVSVGGKLIGFLL